MDKMKEIMYPIRGGKKGVIVSIINKSKPSFGFIIVGKNNKEVFDIHNRMLSIWAIKK